jgi:hypothetical protein
MLDTTLEDTRSRDIGGAIRGYALELKTGSRSHGAIRPVRQRYRRLAVLMGSPSNQKIGRAAPFGRA